MAAPHFPSPETIEALIEAKRRAREIGMARRAGQNPALGAALARHVLEELPPPAGVAVSGFWPLPGEIDIRPLLEALFARGHAVLLPETPKRGNPLIFRHWHPGCAMVRERFGTLRPEGEIGVPGVLYVPLLAFDRQGRRLGYGGGYYDRTLAGLEGAVAVGCAFAVQELDEVPAGDYDARLSAIATERGIIIPTIVPGV
jgi:5-formyltetrahydrofolate cyclo-ligase